MSAALLQMLLRGHSAPRKLRPRLRWMVRRVHPNRSPAVPSLVRNPFRRFTGRSSETDKEGECMQEVESLFRFHRSFCPPPPPRPAHNVFPSSLIIHHRRRRRHSSSSSSSSSFVLYHVRGYESDVFPYLRRVDDVRGEHSVDDRPVRKLRIEDERPVRGSERPVRVRSRYAVRVGEGSVFG